MAMAMLQRGQMESCSLLRHWESEAASRDNILPVLSAERNQWVTLEGVRILRRGKERTFRLGRPLVRV